MKVLTITLNPAIDKTIEIERLMPRSLNKVLSTHYDVGGKGINVSKVLKNLGTNSLALGFIAGASGQFIKNKLKEMAIETAFIEIEGETRTNLKIFDRSDKEITEINEPGANATEKDLKALLKMLDEEVANDCVVVLSGSAPKSLGQDVYKVLTAYVKSKGAKVFLDVDGEGFKQGIEAKPSYIKPNKTELELFFNEKLDSEEKMVKAIRYFINIGIEHVFITLGKNGAYYGSHAALYKIAPLTVEAHSSVGAGDAFVGAVVHSMINQLDLETMLKLAVATSAGSVTTVGTKPVEMKWIKAHMQNVKLEQII